MDSELLQRSRERLAKAAKEVGSILIIERFRARKILSYTLVSGSKDKAGSWLSGASQWRYSRKQQAELLEAMEERGLIQSLNKQKIAVKRG